MEVDGAAAVPFAWCCTESGGDPGGVLLGCQGWGARAQHRPGARSGAVDGRLGFLEGGF